MMERAERVEMRNSIHNRRRLQAGLNEALGQRSFRAFSVLGNELIYKYEGDPNEILRELEPYLRSAFDDTRFLVARLFLQCGFESDHAANVLIELTRRPKTIVGHVDGDVIRDFRLVAAELLADYRVAESADAIWSLYQNTRELQLLVKLAELQDQRAIEPILVNRDKLSQVTQVTRLFAVLEIDETSDSMKEQFARLANRTASESPEKVDLAWSLYHITAEAEYLDFLIENRYRAKASNYLAGIEGAEVVPVLEEMLYSQNGSHEAAFLGLYLNHRDSPVLRKYILAWLDLQTLPRVHENVLLRIASKFDDPEIDAGVIKFSSGSYRDQWRFYKEHRRNFPLYDLYSDRIEYWGEIR
ncbi:hypothetical protein HNR46_004138 [Haloferula luteola]|uniref:Uncharacterized protein n=1 Tax=Haloferula luteola TaxID=595692 RepID=A0A840VEE3_9BACT|nr:hypothetical protein [Haloferula luteola]MBB5353874.1 hypothetical protein [Haloferula luteola]